MFWRAGVVAAAVAGRLRADAVPRQVGHQGRLLEERRHLADVLHCGEIETTTDESAELAEVIILSQSMDTKCKSSYSLLKREKEMIFFLKRVQILKCA